MFILSSVSSGLELWSVNHTSIYEDPESKVFKNIKCLGEISNNWPSDLLATNIYKTLESCWWWCKWIWWCWHDFCRKMDWKDNLCCIDKKLSDLDQNFER